MTASAFVTITNPKWNYSLERLRARGAELVGEVVDYQDVYRLCYIRGPEGLLIGLAQELGRKP